MLSNHWIAYAAQTFVICFWHFISKANWAYIFIMLITYMLMHLTFNFPAWNPDQPHHLSEALPFLVITVGLNKPYVLAHAILTRSHCLGAISRINGLAEFCQLAGLSFLYDFLLTFGFYISVLTVFVEIQQIQMYFESYFAALVSALSAESTVRPSSANWLVSVFYPPVNTSPTSQPPTLKHPHDPFNKQHKLLQELFLSSPSLVMQPRNPHTADHQAPIPHLCFALPGARHPSPTTLPSNLPHAKHLRLATS
ncbi:hypothetical protein PCANC_27188 [Puccinia coronata f. sp. avenae]|uniref:SSD domain-containing protein n=1 Tax=Puccinia coronata f. sp. avenae TaxID=200324 RepID=A0A2N5THG9_9BASI|nr:hypothetical protein PCANC_27188 [Puccinia coronata f. sp. avenae]